MINKQIIINPRSLTIRFSFLVNFNETIQTIPKTAPTKKKNIELITSNAFVSLQSVSVAI